jgi:hypothetical protein
MPASGVSTLHRHQEVTNGHYSYGFTLPSKAQPPT